jgi:hypothetical protein
MIACAYFLCGTLLFYFIPKSREIFSGFNIPLPSLMKVTFAVGEHGWLFLAIIAGVAIVLKDLKFRSRYLNPLFTLVLVFWIGGLVFDWLFLMTALTRGTFNLSMK